MSLRESRQTVTGLVVNAKANINVDYYRTARSMCNSLFRTGTYYRKSGDAPEPIDNLNPLEGMLSHIYFVKARRDRKPQVNRLAVKAGEFKPPHASVDLYRKFLLFKHFVTPSAPVIVTEGVSDITYLKCAIRSLAKSFPSLVEEKDGQITHSVNFLRPTGATRDVLNLGHGALGQASPVFTILKHTQKYVHKPLQHPVIMLCDNDGGADKVFKNAANKCGKKISKTTTDPFYHLGDNLYLVKVPEVTPTIDRDIEDLFEPELLGTVLDGKPFDKKKDHGDETAYGKVVFAEKVVRANASTVDFSGFSDLLSRIDQCLTHYKTVVPMELPAVTTGTPLAWTD
jgi:hypothetical protein